MVEYPVHTRPVTCSSQVAATRPVGQAVKTPPFHGGNMGSIPVRVTKKNSDAFASEFFLLSGRESNPSKCDSPPDCRRSPAGRRTLLFDNRFPYGSPKNPRCKRIGDFRLSKMSFCRGDHWSSVTKKFRIRRNLVQKRRFSAGRAMLAPTISVGKRFFDTLQSQMPTHRRFFAFRRFWGAVCAEIIYNGFYSPTEKRLSGPGKFLRKN